MLPDLKITQLRHFVWVSELKGFHAAAEKAHRTQPAISLSIRDLETKLGESLFEKRNVKTTKAELTPFGIYFLPKAKELIAHHDRVAEDMRLLSEHKTGHLRIASVPSIASRVLPELLEEFMSHSSDLHVSFFDDNSAAVLKMVETQKVDFGIAHLFHEEEHSDKDFIPIWQDQIGVVCPKNHSLAQKESLCWQELKPHLRGKGPPPLFAHQAIDGLRIRIGIRSFGNCGIFFVCHFREALLRRPPNIFKFSRHRLQPPKGCLFLLMFPRFARE